VHTIATRLCACPLVLAVLSVAVLCTSPAAAQGAFYQATDSEIARPVGSLIRKETPHRSSRRGDCIQGALSLDQT
jgi:hypothetical protein